MSTRYGGTGEGLGGPAPDEPDTGPGSGPFDRPPGTADPLAGGFEEPFDDDGIPDAALFLPFRDGRPGWR